MGKASQASDNRKQGKIFEMLFFKRAQLLGLLPLHNNLACKFTYRGKLELIPGDLDFKLIGDGEIGFFDCKSYRGDSFNYSDLEAHQVERALLYNERNIPSGFVVLFLKTNDVYFFSGIVVAGKGPGTSFSAEDGLHLGKYFDFALKAILSKELL